jgi:hypothetical protein
MHGRNKQAGKLVVVLVGAQREKRLVESAHGTDDAKGPVLLRHSTEHLQGATVDWSEPIVVASRPAPFLHADGKT